MQQSLIEKRNLIKRQSDPQHGRILRTELTSKGAGLVKSAHTIIQRLESSMTSTIGESDIVLLDKLLMECFNNLNNGVVTEVCEAKFRLRIL